MENHRSWQSWLGESKRPSTGPGERLGRDQTIRMANINIPRIVPNPNPLGKETL